MEATTHFSFEALPQRPVLLFHTTNIRSSHFFRILDYEEVDKVGHSSIVLKILCDKETDKRECNSNLILRRPLSEIFFV